MEEGIILDFSQSSKAGKGLRTSSGPSTEHPPWAGPGHVRSPKLHLGTMGRVSMERMVSGVSWEPYSEMSPGRVQVLAKPHDRVRIRYIGRAMGCSLAEP